MYRSPAFDNLPFRVTISRPKMRQLPTKDPLLLQKLQKPLIKNLFHLQIN